MKNSKTIMALSFLLTLTLLTSCAGMKKKEPARPKTYGADVEQEFNNIENDQKRVLEYYRTLRAKNWEAYKSNDDSVRRYNQKYSRKKSGVTRYQRPSKRSKVTTKKLVAPKPKPVPLPDNVIEEMKIEIRQHQSYYCMKNRKSSRFSGDADCSAYTENVSNECEKKYPIISDRSLVNCVKRGLR